MVLKVSMLKQQRLLFLIFFLLGIFALFEFTGIRQHLNLSYLREVIHMHPVWGLCLFIGAFCLGNIVQIPGWFFLAAAVLALGKLQGGIVTYMAAIISCGVTFLMIRLIGGDVLRKLNTQWAIKVLSKLDTYPLACVAVLRTFMQTAPALNYALALSGVSFRKYMLGSAIGLPLPIIVYCVFFEFLAKSLSIS